jgi:hypothetical protein
VYPIVDYICNGFLQTWKLLTNPYNEPGQSNWECLALLDYVEYNGDYMEYYNHEVFPAKLDYGLWIKKLENGYYIYNNESMFSYDVKLVTQPEPQYEKSSVYFLSITLLQNGTQFNIKLKRDEYIVGNELLSKVHIARYSKYDGWWRFNTKLPYVIQIMDNRMNVFNIDHTNAIILEKKTYNIINL